MSRSGSGNHGGAGGGAGGGTAQDSGRLTKTVLAYTAALGELQPAASEPSDWAPLVEFVSPAGFRRTGTFREQQDWDKYTEMLTRWASSIDSFETTVLRVTESDRLVFFEIEERHRRGEDIDVVNSLTVFEFDAGDKIRSLDVYLQRGQ